MQIPSKIFLQSIEEKKVYFFSTKLDIPTNNHRHICITKTEDNNIIFTCTTTQEETLNKFLAKKGIPSSTVVYIPQELPCFTKNTFVNCNNIVSISEHEFALAYDKGYIEYKGEISDNHYKQIINGIKDSPLVEEELKEILPNLD